MKHLLKLETLPRADFDQILRDTTVFKRERGQHKTQPLAGQTWALMFSKQSTRTRLSFEVGIRELGGLPMFLSAVDIQLGRGEPIKDTARVMGRMVHGAVIRTFAQHDVEEFASFSGIPTINALTDDEHPCQILADMFTFQETRGSIEGKTVAFIGDGACNVALRASVEGMQIADGVRPRCRYVLYIEWTDSVAWVTGPPSWCSAYNTVASICRGVDRASRL